MYRTMLVKKLFLLKPHFHRSIGSDIKINSLLVGARQALTPFDLGLLASAGVTNVTSVR